MALFSSWWDTTWKKAGRKEIRTYDILLEKNQIEPLDLLLTSPTKLIQKQMSEKLMVHDKQLKITVIGNSNE